MIKINKKLNILKEKETLVQTLQERLINLEIKMDVIEKKDDQKD